MVIEDKVRSIVQEQLSVYDAEITDDSKLVEDLGADSLDIVELIMAFEEEFEIEISDMDIKNNHMKTVKDAIELIKSKTSKK